KVTSPSKICAMTSTETASSASPGSIVGGSASGIRMAWSRARPAAGLAAAGLALGAAGAGLAAGEAGAAGLGATVGLAGAEVAAGGAAGAQAEPSRPTSTRMRPRQATCVNGDIVPPPWSANLELPHLPAGYPRLSTAVSRARRPADHTTI